MAYAYSHTDHGNLHWFENDPHSSTLHTIRIVQGSIRGLSSLQLEFQYPITAIAGRNRSGKTTVLALAACAFHNKKDGYRLPGRKHPYYTYSDFFIQTQGEIPLEGIAVRFNINSDQWAPSQRLPRGVGLGWQVGRKQRGGRWSNYDRRIDRTVVYLGIDRVVPHAEKSVSKSYRSLFRSTGEQGWEMEVRETVGRILGVEYQAFENRHHATYRLPVVRQQGILYSGFNMGAGEDALFGMMSVIRECPDGSLVTVDEIELGLHEEAQARLIAELKEISLRRHIQVIATTHSPAVLDALPPEGRIFIERAGRETRVFPQITSGYAAGKLIGRANPELHIFVEDEVSRLIVEAALEAEVRSRVDIMPLGSSITLMRHLAVRFKEGRAPDACALIDGDKAADLPNHIQAALALIEREDMKAQAREWLTPRTSFLPGPEWPEGWAIVHLNADGHARLTREFGVPHPQLLDILEEARLAGKHNEFRSISQRINYDQQIVAHEIVKAALESNPDSLAGINSFIRVLLEQAN